ncbi:MAG: fumarylacetoacetase [Acidobacteriota bacterium]|nr:fumarylacetoacetase [Acidobacteriota bacterium]
MTVSISSDEWTRTSWVESANEPGNGFPLQSLPYCVFAGEADAGRVGVRIGQYVLDLQACSLAGLMEDVPEAMREACAARTLNPLIACGKRAHAALRVRLMEMLASGAEERRRILAVGALLPVASVHLLKPVEPANYTDFYASIDHATRVGQLFRPDQPLLPNYKYVPIGYHGRASSIVCSGTPVRRPSGQRKSAGTDAPAFGPTRFLDYEVEVAIYIGEGNALGTPVPIDDAAGHVFGISLLNDWSARDIQSWEYQPLGPFLAKSFATSVSPWVVPMDALKPFRCPVRARAQGDPVPLEYLWSDEDQQGGAIDLEVEASLLTAAMRDAELQPHRLSRANLRDLYWTPAQLIAHHTSNGCNLLPGDLLATGTISSAKLASAGCLLELTEGGRTPVVLSNGESRRALEDGDEVILQGFCRRDGYPDVSLGECRTVVVSAN